MTRRALLASPIAAAAPKRKANPPVSLDQIKDAILALNCEDRREFFRWYFGLASTALNFRDKYKLFPLKRHFDIEGWAWDEDL